MSTGGGESDLTARAVAGDAVALTLLLTNTRRRLYRYVERRIPHDLRGKLDADDVVQDAHIEAFRHIGSFEQRRPDAFDRWLTTITARRLHDAIKLYRRAKRGGHRRVTPLDQRSYEDSMMAFIDLLAGPGRTPSRSVARVEAIGAVQRTLEKLPESQRRAIQLVHIEGRAVADAAREMGRTERAIHGLTRRGLVQLRERLGDASAFLSSSG